MITFTAGHHHRCHDDQVPGVRHRRWGVARPAHRDHRREGERTPDRHGRTSAPSSVPACATVFDVLANDVDPDNTTGGLSLVSATQVSGDGDGRLRRTRRHDHPEPEFVGQRRRLVHDPRRRTASTSSAQVTLNVLEPLNRPPVARDDSNEVANGGVDHRTRCCSTTPIPTATRCRSTSRRAPTRPLGSGAADNDRSIAFTAAPGASGTAMIGYEISDGEFTSNATLRITVRRLLRIGAGCRRTDSCSTGYQQPIAVDLRRTGRTERSSTSTGPPAYDGGDLHPAGRRERQRHDQLHRRERLPPAGERHDHDRRQPGSDRRGPCRSASGVERSARCR